MDRLDSFPAPFPDEWLYSLAVRYHRMHPFLSYRRTSHELFGIYSRTCGSIFPCGLGALSDRLSNQYTVDDLIKKTTLIPLYLPFMTEETYSSTIKIMAGSSGTGLKMKLGLTASRLSAHCPFRYCPECIKVDSGTYGVAYWHRIHQVLGVCVCPEHGDVLLETTFPERSDWRLMLLPGEGVSCPALSEKSNQAVQNVAHIQNWALNNPDRVKILIEGRFLGSKLTDLELSSLGKIKERQVLDYAGVRLKECSSEKEFTALVRDPKWVMGLLRDRPRMIQPFKYYLLAWILRTTVDDLESFEKSAELDMPLSKSIKSAGAPMDSTLLEQHREAYISDRAKYCHDRVGYFWLHRNDHDWLVEYHQSVKKTCSRSFRVDWHARDLEISLAVFQVSHRILSAEGRPRQVTKSALNRSIGGEISFLENINKLPLTASAIKSVLETKHAYQQRKIIWALTTMPQLCSLSLSSVLRAAGIRLCCLSGPELNKLISQKS